MTDEMRNKLKKSIDKINGVSEQFVDDIMITFEKYHDNAYYIKFSSENLVSGIYFRKNEIEKSYT